MCRAKWRLLWQWLTDIRPMSSDKFGTFLLKNRICWRLMHLYISISRVWVEFVQLWLLGASVMKYLPALCTSCIWKSCPQPSFISPRDLIFWPHYLMDIFGSKKAQLLGLMKLHFFPKWLKLWNRILTCWSSEIWKTNFADLSVSTWQTGTTWNKLLYIFST